jgi:hypothetical protein
VYERNVYDATAVHPSIDDGILMSLRKVWDAPEIDITGPQDSRNMYFTLQEPAVVYTHDFMQPNSRWIQSKRIEKFNNYVPYTKALRLKPLLNSDYLMVISNWHSVALFDFTDLSKDAIYVDVGSNSIQDVECFMSTKYFIVATQEMINFIKI